MNRPPKYPSTPHWPQSAKVHRDDTIHHDGTIFVGMPVVVTEKIDGGNTCLWNGEVYARSVQTPSGDGWFAMVKKHHGWKTNDPQMADIAFYGEDVYGIHSIVYDAVSEDQTYRLFAVRDANVFMPWDEVEAYATDLSVLTAEVLFRGTFDSEDEITEFFRDELPKPSALGGEREGFVMRNQDSFKSTEFRTNVCKYVRPNHVQTDQHWRRNWQPCKIR